MNYQNVVCGKFLSRPNRFIAHVDLDGKDVVCHVKNTGRCKELLTSNAVVYLEHSSSEKRKTAYDFIAVEKNARIINMDSQAPNKVFGEWAFNYRPNIKKVRTEVQYGQSRIDFCLESENSLHYVEVKGVTLEKDGHVLFPDAPTERGIKHIKELIHAVHEGYQATIFFVIQMENITDFAPNNETQPAFGEALREAQKEGVNVVAYSCKVTPESLEIDREVPVILS